MAFHHDLVNARGAEQERALHTDTIACHAADGERSIVATLAQADDRALEFLNALALAFFDLHVHADHIARCKLGNVLIWFGFESLDNVCDCFLPYVLVLSFSERRRIIAREFGIYKADSPDKTPLQTKPLPALLSTT